MRYLTRLHSLCSTALKISNNNGQFALHKIAAQNYCNIVRKELEVPTFCDVEIDVPYNVQVRPLDVHKYHNCDKLIIQMHQDHENIVEYFVNGNKIKIVGLEDRGDDVVCVIKAPVKANINIKSEKNITVGYFHGDKLLVSTNRGSVFVDRFQGNEIDVQVKNGDITLHNHIQAEKIRARVHTNGSIIGGRLQGLQLLLKTNKGNISVDSAYCEESILVSENGNMNLSNIHKSCKLLLNQGDLNMTGFDGQLTAKIGRGNADIHLSRILGSSEILLKDRGDLKLKLSETCCDYSKFKISASKCEISDTIKSDVKKDGNTLTIKPDLEMQNSVNINCANGSVFVDSSSWQEMIKAKLRKSSSVAK